MSYYTTSFYCVRQIQQPNIFIFICYGYQGKRIWLWKRERKWISKIALILTKILTQKNSIYSSVCQEYLWVGLNFIKYLRSITFCSFINRNMPLRENTMTLSCLQLKIPNIVSEGQSLRSLFTSPHLQKFAPRFHCTTATTKTIELQSFLCQKLLVSQHKYPFLPPDELAKIQSQRQRQTIFAKYMF